MYCNHYAKQRGSGLMIVLFVIVVMGLMAIVMTKIGASSQTITTKEVLGTRAWFSAYSANEVVLTKLFPLGNPLISKPTACKNYSVAEIKTMMPPLQQGCKITSINCAAAIINKINEYKLLSTVTCGSGKVSMTRTQEVWAKGVK
ncbi:MshP protein [uncultured Photobacterium sp.]|uniref:MshP protein n=1 Tax=uncultured Photobacterium sp. TaxID=173973 RepID=UPI002624F545|nr:MshP protein [uncultured Photobacterium sp.]